MISWDLICTRNQEDNPSWCLIRSLLGNESRATFVKTHIKFSQKSIKYAIHWKNNWLCFFSRGGVESNYICGGSGQHPAMLYDLAKRYVEQTRTVKTCGVENYNCSYLVYKTEIASMSQQDKISSQNQLGCHTIMSSVGRLIHRNRSLGVINTKMHDYFNI